MNDYKIDKEVKKLLFKKAQGYDVEEKEVIVNKNGTDKRVKIKVRHIQPDLKAIEKMQELIDLNAWE